MFFFHDRKLVLASQYSHKQTDIKICCCVEVWLVNFCKKGEIQVKGENDWNKKRKKIDRECWELNWQNYFLDALPQATASFGCQVVLSKMLL